MAERKMTREQLKNFIPSYRAGYLSANSRVEKLTEEVIVQKMEVAGVWNESLAEQQGRKDGFEDRNKGGKDHDSAQKQKP